MTLDDLTPRLHDLLRSAAESYALDGIPTVIAVERYLGAGVAMVARRATLALDRWAPPSAQLREERARIEAAARLRPQDGARLRAPHHTVSLAAMRGGSPRPWRPGEAEMALGGVLLLDSGPDFRRPVLRAVRESLRSGAGPAIVVYSHLPCPCGWRGSEERLCSDDDRLVARHRARVERGLDALVPQPGARLVRVPATASLVRGAS